MKAFIILTLPIALLIAHSIAVRTYTGFAFYDYQFWFLTAPLMIGCYIRFKLIE